MAATTLHGPDGVRDALGRHLGHSDWLTITHAHLDDLGQEEVREREHE